MEVRNIAKQIIMALQYLKELKIIHRDLTLANVFLSDQMQVKIGDFGLA